MVPSRRDLGRAGAVDQSDREIAEGGRNLWGVAGEQAGTVFLEADITHIMGAVFNAPMPTVAEDIKALKGWIEPIAKSVGAQVFVTDDADGFKTVADEVGVQHQVCDDSPRLQSQGLSAADVGKQELPGILTACSCLVSGYQLSNDYYAGQSHLNSGTEAGSHVRID